MKKKKKFKKLTYLPRVTTYISGLTKIAGRMILVGDQSRVTTAALTERLMLQRHKNGRTKKEQGINPLVELQRQGSTTRSNSDRVLESTNCSKLGLSTGHWK